MATRNLKYDAVRKHFDAIGALLKDCDDDYSAQLAQEAKDTEAGAPINPAANPKRQAALDNPPATPGTPKAPTADAVLSMDKAFPNRIGRGSIFGQ